MFPTCPHCAARDRPSGIKGQSMIERLAAPFGVSLPAIGDRRGGTWNNAQGASRDGRQESSRPLLLRFFEHPLHRAFEPFRRSDPQAGPRALGPKNQVCPSVGLSLRSSRTQHPRAAAHCACARWITVWLLSCMASPCLPQSPPRAICVRRCASESRPLWWDFVVSAGRGATTRQHELKMLAESLGSCSRGTAVKWLEFPR